MLRASVDTIARTVGGTIVTGDPETMANDLVVDSREVAPGCIFVAFSGASTDGHEHLSAAMEAGARVVVVTQPDEALTPHLLVAQARGAAVIRVADPYDAVQQLASWHRSKLHCPVIGVTGSTGKTTTKDLLDAVLSSQMRVVSTAGNRNNELGVPLTVLRGGSDTDVLIVEMGMRGLGQIARLAQIARPTHGLVTNVGTSHIELLGTQDAVASAKGELVRSLPVDGYAFLNGDDAYSDALAVESAAPVTLYGLSARCMVRAEDITTDEAGLPRFTLVTAQGSVPVSLAIPGRHNVYNALAAAAVGLSLTVPIDAIAASLGAAKGTAMRMESFNTASGVVVINDAYNANPTSMRSAVETLAALRNPGRRIAVLGDMAELGSLSELAHFEIGELVGRSGIDTLVTVGPRAVRFADGARAEGMAEDSLIVCESPSEAIDKLKGMVAQGDAVLVKASRVMGLEAVVEGLVNADAG